MKRTHSVELARDMLDSILEKIHDSNKDLFLYSLRGKGRIT